MSSFSDAEQAPADVDASLLRRLASGDRDALDSLFRRHEEYGRRVATAVAGDPVVADDLMAEAFAAVFRRAASNAPILNFRAYLSACIRNAHHAHLRQQAQSAAASDQPWLFDVALDDPYLVDGIAEEHAAAALASLPARWRELLWRIEVEGRTNAELADLMGKSRSAVSSMTHRAREGLRRAFLDRHVPATRASACRWTRERLSRYVRGELSDRTAGRVRSHVSDCAACESVWRDLESLNRRMGASLWPVVLAGAGPTLPAVVPSPDGSSTPSPDASTMSTPAQASANVSSSAGLSATLAGASPVTLAVVCVAAAGVLAASAFAVRLASTDAGPAGRQGAAAAAPGGAAVDEQEPPVPPAAEPPAGPLARAAAPLSGVEAEAKEDEEEEDSLQPPAPTATAPPPTYDASIGSVDKSDVSGQAQSLTFSVQMDSSGPRTGVVLNLAITIDSDDTTDWRFAVDQVSGPGWECRAPDGEDISIYVYDRGTTLTCSYTFGDEDDPPPMTWDLLFDDGDGQMDGATGSVSVSVVGKDDPDGGNDTETF